MKKLVAIIVSLFIVFSIVPVNAVSHTRLYALQTVIINFGYREDKVIALDDDGNIWLWYGIEDWLIWDLAMLTMLDPGTPQDPTDDIVMHARYIGWIDPLR